MFEFINLFCIPCITVYLHYRRIQKEPVLSGRIFLQYGIAVFFVCLISQVIYKVICNIRNIDFHFASTSYAVVALIVSVLLPLIYDFLRKFFSVRVEVETNKREEFEKKEG